MFPVTNPLVLSEHLRSGAFQEVLPQRSQSCPVSGVGFWTEVRLLHVLPVDSDMHIYNIYIYIAQIQGLFFYILADVVGWRMWIDTCIHLIHMIMWYTYGIYIYIHISYTYATKYWICGMEILCIITWVQLKDLFRVRVSTNIDSAARVHPTIALHMFLYHSISTWREMYGIIIRKHTYIYIYTNEYANKYARL